MKMQPFLFCSVLLLGAHRVSAQGSLLTYQGRLTDGTNPANGNYEILFRPFAVSSGGTQSAFPNIRFVAVTNGLFTTTISYGDTIFDGSPVYLQLEVRTNGAPGYTIVTPRQQLTPAPYAIFSSRSAGVIDGAIGGAQLANSISLGTSNVNGRLDVYRNATGTPAISLIGSSGQINAYGDDGQQKARMQSASYGGRLTTWDDLGIETAHVGSATDAGGVLFLYQPNGNLGVNLDGASSQMNTYAANGQLKARVESASYGGRLTTWDDLGNETAHVGSATDAGGVLFLYQANGNLGVNLEGDSSGTSGGGSVNVRNSGGNNRVFLSGQSTGGGGGLFLYDNDGTSTVELNGAEGSASGAQLMMKQANGTTTIQLDAEVGNGGGGYLRLYKGDGTTGLTLQADVSGESKITTQVLQITGGSDLSEQFDINAQGDELAPGTIVCIDAAHPGQLVRSTKPYDRTVAGVMSGAGGVKPGMLMGQQGTAADGKHPVALSGRVFCEADASNGAIRPGDMLTTSNRPGHAMKVTDYDKAHGAIIGKAMSSLDKDEGLVLVLVSLQ